MLEFGNSYSTQFETLHLIQPRIIGSRRRKRA